MDALSLIPGLSKLLDYFAEKTRRRQDRRDEALLALLAAAVETKIYLESLQGKARRKKREESDLASLWQKAAVPVRYFDADLATLCLDKAGDYISPQSWDSSQVRAKGIELQQICMRIRQLLRE